MKQVKLFLGLCLSMLLLASCSSSYSIDDLEGEYNMVYSGSMSMLNPITGQMETQEIPAETTSVTIVKDANRTNGILITQDGEDMKGTYSDGKVTLDSLEETGVEDGMAMEMSVSFSPAKVKDNKFTVVGKMITIMSMAELGLEMTINADIQMAFTKK